MTEEQVATMLTNHNDRLEVIEKDVENFRKFQSGIKGKIGFVYGATWAAGIAGTVLLLTFAWALTEIVPAAKIVIDDYYARHPVARIEQKTVVNPLPKPYTAASKTLQFLSLSIKSYLR